MQVDLKDEALAQYLAEHLSDLEFELVIRKRIKLVFDHMQDRVPQLEDSHNACRFVYNWCDKCEWKVEVGSTYRDSLNEQGEVLGMTIHNAEQHWLAQNANKLSLLLPPPEQRKEDVEPTGFSE